MHFYWSTSVYTPLPFSIKSESHYPSDGLISVCAVMQRETEYQIGFNINLSWKRCICMKQKTAFHDYSFSDKIFIAAHIGSWVSHEAFLNLMSDFMCEIFTSKFLFLENLIIKKKNCIRYDLALWRMEFWWWYISYIKSITKLRVSQS